MRETIAAGVVSPGLPKNKMNLTIFWSEYRVEGSNIMRETTSRAVGVLTSKRISFKPRQTLHNLESCNLCK